MAEWIVTFGEIMLRLSPPGHLRLGQARQFDALFGGGEANVAVSLAHFGLPARFVSRLPAHELGDAALGELRRHGVDTSYVLRGGERMGIYFLEHGAVSRGSKVLYDRAFSAISEIQPGMADWRQIFEGARGFHFTGITPALSQSAANACLEAAIEARRQGLAVSVDLNYRKMLWKYGKKPQEVMEKLVECCDLLIGNEEDAEKVFGIHAEGVDVRQGESVRAEAYASVGQQLMERFPNLRRVALTLRGSVNASHNRWSGVLWNGSALLAAPSYDITHIVDRVGGGDAFAAGLIYGLLRWPSDEAQALAFAVAASCLKHTIHGDFNEVSVEEVEKLMSGDGSGRVSR